MMQVFARGFGTVVVRGMHWFNGDERGKFRFGVRREGSLVLGLDILAIATLISRTCVPLNLLVFCCFVDGEQRDVSGGWAEDSS
jgi:hypothetical protein